MPKFDVEPAASYYGAYSDIIVVGDSKPTVGVASWDRVVSGSSVSGSNAWRVETLYSEYVFGRENTFRQSGEPRLLRLASVRSTYVDSIPPDPIRLHTTGASNCSGSMCQTNGTGLIGNINTTLYQMIVFSRVGYVTESASNQRVSNVDWATSFPFEKKYQGITQDDYKLCFFRPKQSGTDQLTWLAGAPEPATPNAYYVIHVTNATSQPDSSKTYEIYAERTGNDALGFLTDVGTTNSDAASKLLTNKAVFGINPRGVSATVATYDGDTMSFLTGALIDGWKYGLLNGVPTNTSAVYRQNHYGQPRDLLEGRLYSKTTVDAGPFNVNGGVRFISGSALPGESNNYLTASIYATGDVGVASAVNPYGSGLFDKECRSTQPWHDDDPRVTIRPSL